MMDDTEVQKIVEDLTLFSGKTISNEEIKEQLKQAQVKRITEQGRVSLTNDKDPCKATIINYKGLISSVNGVSMCTNTTPKTRTRYTTENSLISAMALLCVIATTYYDVASSEKELEIKKLVRHNKVPEGVSLFYKLISKTYGRNIPLIPVETSRITSTDDTTNYIYEGVSGGDEGKFQLVASPALQKAGARSRYKLDETKKMCDMRVKLTYTFSAAGIIAPLFISVVGLTELELPMYRHLVLKIEGLSVGGGCVTIGNRQVGYLMLVRGERGIEKERYSFYRDQVLLPFIENSRKEFSTNYEKGTKVPRHLKAVSWCDGDLAQIDNIVSRESISLYRENMIIACKQNAARSGVEQAADLTKVFKLMHRFQKTVPVSNIPVENHPLKNWVSKSFKNLQEEGKLNLKGLQIAHLIDFISSFPEMIAKAVMRKNITHGFKVNGLTIS